jgi:hypothetical protein
LKKGETIKFDSIQSSNWSNNDEIELRKKIKREKEKSEIFDNTYKTFTNTTMDSINSSTTNCKDTSKSKDTTTCNLCNCKDKTCRLCKNLITKNILPESNNYYSLGQPNLVWKDIFCGPNSLHIGNSVIGTTGFNNTILKTGSLFVDGDLSVTGKINGTNLNGGTGDIGYQFYNPTTSEMFYTGLPATFVYGNTGTQSIPQNTETYVQWLNNITNWQIQSFRSENLGLAFGTTGSTSGATGSFYCTLPNGGMYTISGYIGWQTNLAGTRKVYIYYNSQLGVEINRIASNSGGGTLTSPSLVFFSSFYLPYNYYFSIVVWHNSSSNASINVETSKSTITRIA